MSERENYSEMSPESLNQNLKDLVGQLRPSLVDKIFDEMSEHKSVDKAAKIWSENIEMRDRSEHKEAVLNKLGGLLKYSKGTERFSKYIIQQVGNFYVNGIEQEDFSIKGFFGIILDVENENGAGIFDETRVDFIEYRSLVHTLSEHLQLDEVMAAVLNKGMSRIFSEELGQWISEYPERYKRIPEE